MTNVLAFLPVNCTVRNELIHLLDKAVQAYSVAVLDATALEGEPALFKRARNRVLQAYKLCELRRSEVSAHDRSHGCVRRAAAAA